MRSTFRVSFFLKRNAKKRDGTVPIIARITINGKVSQFSTKLHTKPTLWSVKLSKMKGQNSNAKNINSLLDEIKARIYSIYHEQVIFNKEISSEVVKNKFLGISTEEKQTLISSFDEHNDKMKKMVGVSCSKSIHQKYCLVRKLLHLFLREKYNVSDITLQSINYSFICDFENYLKLKHKYSVNTTAKTMQRFKKIVNISINNNIIHKNPFVNYKIKTETIEREFLSEEELKILLTTDFENERIERVRDVFIFSCFTGLAYIDIKNLHPEDIIKSFDNKLWIIKERQKTKVQSRILLLDIPLKILKKYENKLQNNKLLPVLSNQKMNSYLKEIADICGIKKKLTFHLARHTFATTVTLSKGVPIETVSKMLGHTNIKTTQIYAKVVNSKISQDMAHLSKQLEGMNQLTNI